MQKRLFYTWFILVLLFAQGLQAQDVHLSQFYETPLMRNPALAGIFTGDVRVQAVYRNQWRSVTQPYVTKALSGEYKFPVGFGNDFLTVGLQTFHDVAGVTRLNTLELMPGINFHKALSNDKSRYLSAGFMAGFVQRYFSDKNLTFDNQYNNGRFDAAAPSGENFSSLKRSFLDYAAGLSFNSVFRETGGYYIGASVYHFTKPVESFMNQNFTLLPKYQVNAGLRTPFTDVLALWGEFNYLKQGPYTEIMLGGLLTYHLTDMNDVQTDIKSASISGGAFIRFNDAVVPVVKLNYNQFEIGLSYDANISKLSAASQGRGGYELSLSYKGFLNKDNSTLHMVMCPGF